MHVSKEKIKVCFYPTCKNGTNHFLRNLSRVLEDSGDFECRGFLDMARAHENVFGLDVYHFNWFDQSEDIISFFYRLYILIRLRIAKKRIVWTVHNAVPHRKVPWYNCILRKLLLHFSDAIHIMSEGSRNLPMLAKVQKKVRMIPHGDYFGSYPHSDVDVRRRHGIPADAPVILFLGAVQPYKNVDVLVRAFSRIKGTFRNFYLLICGKVTPEGYLGDLQSLGMERVVFSPQFVPDEEMDAYIREAAFMVAPYSFRSALNSGTVLLACSYGKTVVTPDIMNVRDIQEESGGLYVYHYDSQEEHEDCLVKLLEDAMNDSACGKITDKENGCLRYMENHSWNSHKEEWCNLYRA